MKEVQFFPFGMNVSGILFVIVSTEVFLAKYFVMLDWLHCLSLNNTLYVPDRVLHNCTDKELISKSSHKYRI